MRTIGLLPRAGVQGVAQAVAEAIEPDPHDHDGQAGDGGRFSLPPSRPAGPLRANAASALGDERVGKPDPAVHVHEPNLEP